MDNPAQYVDEYPTDFQKLLITSLLADHNAFKQCRPYLREEYFDDTIKRAIRTILAHVAEHNQIPAANYIEAKCNIQLPPPFDPPMDTATLVADIEKFCRFKATEYVVLEGFDLMLNGKADELPQRMKDARSIKINDTKAPADVSEIDISRLPPRRWLYLDFLVRGMVTALVGPGGTGKTSLGLGMSLSVALGKDLLANDDEPSRVKHLGAVMYWNLEDSLDEMMLRITAEIKHRSINQADLKGKFYALSGRDVPLCVAERNAKGNAIATDLSAIIEMLRERRITLLVIDPLVNAHALDGNSNSDLAMILDQLRKIAHEADCAVLVVHHFRKGGHAGDVESSLGAVTLTNGCRVVETLTVMTEDDASACGIALNRRRSYVRRDNAKMNLSPAPTECEWYEFLSVPLENGTDEYPDGDWIGVLSRWKPLPALTGCSLEQVEQVLDLIDDGIGKEYYTSAPNGKRWAGNLLMQHLGMKKEQAKTVLAEWLNGGVLAKTEYNSPEANYAKAKRLYLVPDGKAKIADRMNVRA